MNQLSIPQAVRIWITRLSYLSIGVLVLWLCVLFFLGYWARPRFLGSFQPIPFIEKNPSAVFCGGYEQGIPSVEASDGIPMLSIESRDGVRQWIAVDRQALGLPDEPEMLGIVFMFAYTGSPTFEVGFCRLNEQKEIRHLSGYRQEGYPQTELSVLTTLPSIINLRNSGKRLGDYDAFALTMLADHPGFLLVHSVYFYDYTRSARFVRKRFN
ncbi:MAG TPA: hypothetical protein PLG59_17275 [bacterium]|nr:hypothetical protein [bacterium]HQO36418.1 hypothetical protein [bacterium]HQQ00907.1 hypothetical protein [bacterium]